MSLDNSLALKAGTSELRLQDPATATKGFFVKPIRNVGTGAANLVYDAASGEITVGSSGGVSGDITVSSITTTAGPNILAGNVSVPSGILDVAGTIKTGFLSVTGLGGGLIEAGFIMPRNGQPLTIFDPGFALGRIRLASVFAREIYTPDGSTSTSVKFPGRGSESTQLGGATVAWGTNSIAMGNSAQAQGDGGTAVGFGARSVAANSVAVGGTSQAFGGASVAIGYGAQTLAGSQGQGQGVAIGNFANADGEYSVAIGARAKALATQSIVLNAQYGTSLTVNTPGFYVKPLRNMGATANLGYNVDTGEVYLGSSSRRYKTDIVDVEAVESTRVFDLRPVSYRGIDAEEGAPKMYGFIAE